MSSVEVCTVIITYNGIEWIERCVNSILHSNIQVDIFVIDNGSIDGTYEYLSKKRCCKYLVQSNENLGFGKANNLALKEAYKQGYHYFLLLNQDAWVEKNVVGHLISSMQGEPEYGIVSPLHYNGNGSSFDYFFESYLSRMDSYQKDLKTNSIKDSLYESSFINAACWLINRNTLEKVGLFHPLFDHYGEDDNYIDRLHHQGLKLGLDHQVKIYHDRGEVNPLKEDPDRLFRRTILKTLLHPQHNESKRAVFKKARKISKKLSRQMPRIVKFLFRIRCIFEFFRIYLDVRGFENNRQSELNI